jgi:SagB-type dehydrogenase family enzyme
MRVEIGPYILPGQSACYDCLRRVYAPPQEDPTPAGALFWVGHAALLACHLISRIANPPLHNSLHLVEYTEHGMVNESRTVARVPGCARCGPDGQVLDVHSPGFMAWLLHTATAMPPRELLSPRDHQQHYNLGNVQLTRMQSEATYGAQSLPLPSASAVGGPLPWLDLPLEEQELDLEGLAAILSRSAGLHPTRNTGARVAPTGGNLGSVELFVLAQHVKGLAPGVYRYHAPRHMLERYPAVPIATLRGALGTAGVLPSCVIVGTGALGKTRGKYHSFGYRLVHFDAGVAIAYIRGIAAGLGVAVREYPNFYDAELAEAIGLHTRDSRFVPTFALGLGTPAVRSLPIRAIHRGIWALDYVVEAAQLPGVPAQPRRMITTRAAGGRRPSLDSLEEVLLTRRAVRSYADQSVPSDLLRELLREVMDVCRERATTGAAAPSIVPYMAVQVGSTELPTGFYTISPASPTQLIPVRQGATFADLHRCVLQSSLAAAPVVLFMVGDFEQATRERGARGYRELLMQAGAALGRAWLAATAYGLVGCASGGFMEAGLRSLLDLDGYRTCPLIALCLGRPAGGMD